MGFDLRLMSWGDGSGAPTSGKNLVVVGTDNNGLLHIRIFDAAGNRIKDTDETQLPAQAAAIATLKQQLPGLLPPHVLTDAEKVQVIAEATSIVGQTRPMPKRQMKRKVVIHLKQRDPSDPSLLLQAVEKAFRPREIEISVEEPSNEAPPAIPDEQLETAVREHAAEVLDEQDRRLREAPRGRAARPKLQATKRRTRNLRNRLKVWVTAGWRIVVKLLPVAEQAAKTAKAVGDLFG